MLEVMALECTSLLKVNLLNVLHRFLVPYLQKKFLTCLWEQG